ncbi:hypothetical protein JCM3766R1_003093 [Sporobolomyces carnicolor]
MRPTNTSQGMTDASQDADERRERSRGRKERRGPRPTTPKVVVGRNLYAITPSTKFGEVLKSQVEERLAFYDNGSNPTKNADAMKKALDAHKAEVAELGGDEAAAAAPAKMDVDDEVEESSSKKDKKKKRKREIKTIFTTLSSALANLQHAMAKKRDIVI